ncbi:hypothetical protein QO259_10295 [Salinicola sp. JS01]|uniref:hypothetical protein n=1 Tax=Salinicola sp. JS01 TaxID=3050071 RepID=UPI00255BD7DE|nr:hypothetical protein [Salinicola sp. JS01]WIX31224.1 hypothetical protein QO259_10295 [Salinicola sp. JS01]
MATTQPTAEQWKAIEADVMRLFHPVYLDCDGYLVRLMLERVGKLRLGIVVHVDSRLDPAWLGLGEDGPTEIGERFFQERTMSVYRGKQKRLAKRVMGKKESEKKISHRHPWWESTTSMRRHLVANNDAIRLLEDEEVTQRHEALKAQRAAKQVAS